MGTRIAVLDHGFVELKNLAGPVRRADEVYDASDRDPSMSARMSFNRMNAARAEKEDLKLAEYLIKNKHSTPFEMIECWIEMKMPIFVARQFVRHRTVSINEVSARYVQLPPEWYIPDPRIVGIRPDQIKQGRLVDPTIAPTQTALLFCEVLQDFCKASYGLYEAELKAGVPPELARMFLHLNHYTHWLWKQDLHNIMHFLSLRVDSHAQYEAQQYAQAIITLLREHLPHSMELFDKYRRVS